MSLERQCIKCGYVEKIRFNFGSDKTAEEEFHKSFRCPKCNPRTDKEKIKSLESMLLNESSKPNGGDPEIIRLINEKLNEAKDKGN